MQLRAWWQVRHQPGQPGDGQPVGDHALFWLAHGGGGDAAEGGQKEQVEGEEDPLDDRRGSGRRQ